MQRTELGPGIYTLDAVLDAKECADLVARAEATGFKMASIDNGKGGELRPQVRNNDRVTLDDTALAADLWMRVGSAFPEALWGRRPKGLNERFRFYRYTPGQKFVWHSDGRVRRGNGDVSLLTFMIYLNGDYSGGETAFEKVRVHGRPGMALVFTHELLHEGAEVTAGVKYVLRSDVMYGL